MTPKPSTIRNHSFWTIGKRTLACVYLLTLYVPPSHLGAQVTGSGINGASNQSASPSSLSSAAAIAFGGSTEDTGEQTGQVESESQLKSGVPVPMSADQVIQVLQENPDAMAEVKQQIAERLQQQGMQIQPADVSDDTVYSQITSDTNTRNAVSQYLQVQGYAPASSVQADGTDSFAQRVRPEGDSPMGNARLTTGSVSTQNAGLLRPELNDATTKHSQRFENSNAMRSHDSDQSISDKAGITHQQPPYDLQAMRDLYAQITTQSQPLKRFGSDIFTNRKNDAMGNGVASSDARLDVPLGPDHVISTGDSLKIDLWGGITQSFTRVVSSDGKILLPEAGELQIAGLPLGKAENLIRVALAGQYRNAQVSVTLSAIHSVRVYVVGDVQRPGGYDISSLATPVSALYAAGGPTASGSLRIARHFRGRQLIEEIDLYDFLLRGLQNSSARFESGDTLQVPPVGAQVAISGAVKRAAIYELKTGESSLSMVIEYAGGTTVAASLGHITVERIDPHRGRTTVTLKGSEKPDAAADQNMIQGFAVQDGDRILIAPVLPYSESAVYLQGHFARPGKVSYIEGMHLSDVLHSYRDLLPEPADHGEIIRLIAPDFHAETITFNVPDVLVGNSALALQPFDTVRVFGRYQVDTPTVTIHGEVLRTGTFPLSQGMTAGDLVRMAGGFKRDALVAEADLTSYQVQNGSRVEHNLKRVAIGAAVDHSDPHADVQLKPGDILTIHQITGWNEIGESVTILGQVAFPGSYGFREGERLSSVLRRAGGMRDTAYPAGAVLIREQVRELEEKSRQELIRQIDTNSSAARLGPALGAGDTGGALALIKAQQDQALAQLKAHPATGRMVIHITADIDNWVNTPVDVELRKGDVLTIPKRPGFVLVTGQVYNSTALTFTPDKTAEWYLSRAGGANATANRKEVFIIRANGSVVGRRSGGWFNADVLSTKLDPGDVVVLPQKIIGASLLWRNLLSTAQIASSIAITAGIATAAL